MINLSLPADRERLSLIIRDDINTFCETLYDSEHRNHLGASVMGEECYRKLWYTFRWVKKEKHPGRVLRLFNVGHQAEPRFISYLVGIGFEVREKAEDDKQYRISGANGHYGGSLDCMLRAPARYQITEDVIFLGEFKTNGTGTGFSNVEKEDLIKAKPIHFSQMSQYGYKLGLKYGLYLIENKNDSSIIVKIVELDWKLGASLERKAEEIINSREPPARIADSPAMFNCKFCAFTDICHHGESVEKNCRSCRNSMPTIDGTWTCSKFGVIPEDFIKEGCQEWLGI